MHTWYIDDGAIVANCFTAREIIDFIKSQGPRYGIFLNLSKTEIIWPSGSPCLADPFSDLDVIRYDCSNFDVLGVPIGDADFSDKWVLDKVVNKASNVISHLSDLHDSQMAYLFLKFCLSYCKMVFYIRNIPLEALSQPPRPSIR